jgi:hypothetical protein
MMALCSAPIESFNDHLSDFGEIVDSIQFEPRSTPNARGYYRDFMETKEYNQHWFEPIVMFFYPLKTMSEVANCPRAKDKIACSFKRKPPQIRIR